MMLRAVMICLCVYYVLREWWGKWLTSGQAHVKAALVGTSVTIPITNGKLNLGTWQGIWFLEFRDSKHTRKVIATIQGEKM